MRNPQKIKQTANKVKLLTNLGIAGIFAAVVGYGVNNVTNKAPAFESREDLARRALTVEGYENIELQGLSIMNNCPAGTERGIDFSARHKATQNNAQGTVCITKRIALVMAN